MFEIFGMLEKVLMWVEVQPGVWDRILDGYDCRVRDYGHNATWEVTQDFHQFDVLDSGTSTTVAEAKSKALDTVKANRPEWQDMSDFL